MSEGIDGDKIRRFRREKTMLVKVNGLTGSELREKASCLKASDENRLKAFSLAEMEEL